MWYKNLLNNNQIKLNIKGKNLYKLIKILIINNVELLHIDYPKHDQIVVKINYNDFQKVSNLTSNFEVVVVVVEYCGLLKLNNFINSNKHFLITLFIGYLILIIVSNIIFDVQVIHSNINIRSLILSELNNSGIKRLRFKKNFEQIQVIEKEIINNNKDKIEWLEINEIGSKYIITVEERKLEPKKENISYQHIVAKRKGIVKSIEASNGDVICIVNQYVDKGDILISGVIQRGDNIIKNVKAKGKVYAEVWYTTRVEYPLIYREEYETERIKNKYAIKFLSRRLTLFNFNPFKHKRIIENKIISHPLLPLQIVKEQQIELNIIDESYTHEEAITRAGNIARKKVQERLTDNENIISQRNLDISIEEDKIIVNIFFSVYENIGIEKPFLLE